MLKYAIPLLLTLVIAACGDESARNSADSSSSSPTASGSVDEESLIAIDIADAWTRLQLGDTSGVSVLLDVAPDGIQSVRWFSSLAAPDTVTCADAHIVINSATIKAVGEAVGAWLVDNQERSLEAWSTLDTIAMSIMASHRTLASHVPYVHAGLLRGWVHKRMRDAGFTEEDYAPLAHTEVIVAAARSASLRELMVDPPG
ncbi:MAG: hypothetical protein DYG93_11985 [Leptolyngbya sp. PLA2]|nr:hypothetical protein [Leptolyngbya sp.]MCE7972365.1 hypothetical protein [Leptolyngbya sp. PL-A2]MCZ7632504.1 hypothetical protein [Phycisphaerales bacterium]MDL1905040.1 hypothetical protein [Synechococcales cyanobacterium CNB]GIK19939.1 MAG: hypothetical protein BroJett004_21030 [Planctomycetota bacterium]